MTGNLHKSLIELIEEAIKTGNISLIKDKLDKLHPADIADILEKIPSNLIHKLVISYDNKEKIAEALTVLDDDEKKNILKLFSSSEIAKYFVENLDSDEAASIIENLDEEKQEKVLAKIKDIEWVSDIVDLLHYEEGSAGSIMAKELIKVNENWSLLQCVKEIRKQAEELEDVYAIYVVDDNEILLGIVSLKKIFLAPTNVKIKELYDKDIISVKVNDSIEKAIELMKKYDLVVLPVIDEIGRLVGRITIDDAVDIMQEEAEKDYQMASGISEDVDAGDKIWILSRSRLPWLMIGLIGEIINSKVISQHENAIHINPHLAFFMPLIAAMGGNSGVQSSAIVVQGLANKSLNADIILPKIIKEFFVALINGLICALVVLSYNIIFMNDYKTSFMVSISLLSVILFATIFGAFVPLMLHKFKIDPALATGPFITTANDILAMIIYFAIGTLFF